MGPRSPEGKAAKAILNAIDKVEMNEPALAYMIYNSISGLHSRLFRVFMHLIDLWAADYDSGNLTKENMDTVVNAKRIQEFMSNYRN